MKLYTTVPPIDESCTNQTELSSITDEEFQTLFKPNSYKWYHRVYQAICFFVFLGPLRIIIPLFLFLLFMVFVVLGRLVLHYLGLGNRYKHVFLKIAVLGFRFLLYSFGHLYIKVNGKIDPEARIIISNHLGFADPFAIEAIVNTSSVMKIELSRNPVFSLIYENCDPIYVDRSKSTGVTHYIIERANDTTKAPILIFPEAVTTNANYMMKFHRGAFVTDKKVQPICLRYYQLFVPKGWNTYAWPEPDMLSHILRLLTMPFSWITIDVLPTMTLKDDANGNVDEFALKAQLIMANHLKLKAINRSSDEIYRARKQKKD